MESLKSEERATDWAGKKLWRNITAGNEFQVSVYPVITGFLRATEYCNDILIGKVEIVQPKAARAAQRNRVVNKNLVV